MLVDFYLCCNYAEHGNAISLPYDDEDFDSLVCTQVLEYVHDVDAALTEFYRVLQKGGKIALLELTGILLSVIVQTR